MKSENRAAGSARIAIPLSLAVVLMAGLGTNVAAQYATSIPFNPWQAQYEAFVYPVVSSNLALPNQARNQYGYGPIVRDDYQGFGAFPDYASWLNSLNSNLSMVSPENRDRVGATNGGRYLPYYSFHRLYDADYNRQYTPNAEVDKPYYEDRQRREELYLKTLSEQDPQKRAKLLRELDEANRAMRKELGAARRRSPGEPTASSTVLPPAPELGRNARRATALARPSAAAPRPTEPAGTVAPGVAAEPPMASRPGLPASSLRRPTGGVGIGRPAYPRSSAPDPALASPLATGSGTDRDRDPALDAPSRRRTPTTSLPRR